MSQVWGTARTPGAVHNELREGCSERIVLNENVERNMLSRQKDIDSTISPFEIEAVSVSAVHMWITTETGAARIGADVCRKELWPDQEQ